MTEDISSLRGAADPPPAILLPSPTLPLRFQFSYISLATLLSLKPSFPPPLHRLYLFRPSSGPPSRRNTTKVISLFCIYSPNVKVLSAMIKLGCFRCFNQLRKRAKGKAKLPENDNCTCHDIKVRFAQVRQHQVIFD